MSSTSAPITSPSACQWRVAGRVSLSVKASAYHALSETGLVARLSRYDLLILDYGGVCTMSHHELMAATVRSDRFNAERSECLTFVLAVQALEMQVVVLSNEIDREWVKHSSVLAHVDHVIACSDNGILKPDRRAYQRALLVSGCVPERTLFVDDDIDNVRGALGAGLTAMLFDTRDPAASWSAIEAEVRLP